MINELVYLLVCLKIFLVDLYALASKVCESDELCSLIDIAFSKLDCHDDGLVCC